MGAIRFRIASLAAAAILGLTAGAPLRDAPPVWHEDDRRDAPPPAVRDPSLLWQGAEAVLDPIGRLADFGRVARRVGTVFGGDPAGPAGDVNALDEVPNSSWFTNRIGLFPLTPRDVARGPGDGRGPDRDAPWTVVGAKNQGVTPGFRIRDARGDVYFIKFDPPDYPGMASAAGVITGKILYAAGYNVPEDVVVTFRREDLTLKAGITLTLPDGSKREMIPADLDTILARVPPEPDGSRRAIASKLLGGTPVGPFNWKGTRGDDPNDRIDHQARRELRALRVIAGWVNHFDLKQNNTLDMAVEEGGRRYVRHHLIDFASSLGAGAVGPRPLYGFEYSTDFPAIGGRLLALGFHEDQWRRLSLPGGLPEIGYFESERFDPAEWKPLTPNAAFADLTPADGYWGAKIVSSFTDAHLAAAVAEGKYRDPEAARTMVRILSERRDRIARYWFDRVPPLDFFRTDGTTLRFHDLGAERGIYPGTRSRYRVRAALVDADRRGGGWTGWTITEVPEADLAGVRPGAAGARPFLALEAEVDRGRGWSDPVRVYVAGTSGRVVGVER
jgi:hypothetical protein